MKAFAVNSQNIKQEMGIQVTFISVKKFQKEQFSAKYDCFSHQLMCPSWVQLGWACAHVLHHLRTEKEGIWGKYSKYKKVNWHTNKLHVGNKHAKVHFEQIMSTFLAANMSFLNPC